MIDSLHICHLSVDERQKPPYLILIVFCIAPFGCQNELGS
jgi:hypothetical protein